MPEGPIFGVATGTFAAVFCLLCCVSAILTVLCRAALAEAVEKDQGCIEMKEPATNSRQGAFQVVYVKE